MAIGAPIVAAAAAPVRTADRYGVVGSAGQVADHAGDAKTAAAAEVVPVYAHRGGVSDLVENTRENFRRAAGLGSLFWEADVRFSSTNYPVLLHDADLRRFGCPDVKVAAVSVPKARECAAANGQTLTTLYEFVEDLTSRSAVAMVELKTVPTAAQWTLLESRLSPVRDRVVIESFESAARVAASARGYQTAALTKTVLTSTRLPEGSDWYAPEWRTLTESQVQAMHDIGVKVVVWTPDCSDWGEVPTGVDALISNDLPAECQPAIKQ